MKQQEAEFIQEALDEECLDASVRDDYSGRCMYGDTTHAVVTNSDMADVLACVIRHTKEQAERGLVDEIPDFIQASLRTDSMGRGIVIY